MSHSDFRPIRHYEGVYEINPYGTIRAIARTCGNGKGSRVLSARIISSWPNRTGMLRAHLTAKPSDGTKQPKCRMIHGLVAEAFLPPAPGPVGSKYGHYRLIHLDGDKTNNHFSNIQYIENLPSNRHNSRKKGDPFDDDLVFKVETSMEVNAIDTYLNQLAALKMDSILPVPSVLMDPIKEDPRNAFDLSQALGVDVWVIHRIRRGTPLPTDIGTWHPLNLTLSKS